MLRISVTDGKRACLLVLEGKLVAPWTDELRSLVLQITTDSDQRELIIDVSGVTAISSEGEDLLLWLIARHAKFRQSGVYMRQVLKQLVRRADQRKEGESMSKLAWKLLTKKRAGVTQGLPPGKEDLAWVANTVTMIYGERDAVLVDTFLSVQHTNELVDWIAESGKNLTAIYITHAHGDHFLGLKPLLDRFPNVRAFATASTVAAMQNQIEPDFIKSFWELRFPGQVPSELALPEVIEGDFLHLEGEELHIVQLGHTDTVNSTALHVPSIGLVVSGDAVYNNTHLYLAECDEKARGEWLSALDKIEALRPRAVVTGHGVVDPDSSPRHIEATRRYIRDLNAILPTALTTSDLYQKMLALHPNRVNPGSLWATAKALRPE